MTSKFDSMGKEQLRAACRTAGISYGKLNNDGMRAALAAGDAAQGIGEAREGAAPAPAAPTKRDVAAAAAKSALADVKTVVEVKPAKVEVAPVKGPREHSKGYSGKGLKIEKDRQESNGVKRPSLGGITRSVWDALDALYEQRQRVAQEQDEEGDSEAMDDENVAITFADLRALMKQHGWAKNTAMTQFQRWKKFNGLTSKSE